MITLKIICTNNLYNVNRFWNNQCVTINLSLYKDSIYYIFFICVTNKITDTC